MITNQIYFSTFFLYFVLMNGECSEITNCNLQRYINWYTFDSLVVENFDNDGKKNKNNKIEPPTASYF